MSAFVLSDETYAYVVKTRRIYSGSARRARRATAYRGAIDSEFSNPGPAPPATSRARTLRRTRLPVEPYLTTRVLGIVPHGILNYLAFAALDIGDGALRDKYVLFSLPSASVLQFVRHPVSAGGGVLGVSEAHATRVSSLR